MAEPEEALSKLGLKPGDNLADIGCGDGFFSIPAARIVGPVGQVYAIDATEEAIELFRAAVANSGLGNIHITLGNAEETAVCQGCADVALMANVLHDFENPLKVLENIKKTLKPGGVLADLDWKKEPRQMHGPPLNIRLSQEEASAMLQQAGFNVFDSSLSGPFHYLLLARLKS